MPARSIARWNGASWSPIGSGVGGWPAVPSVYALEVFDDGTGPALYAGGSFSMAGGVPAEGIAKWNGTSWSALGSGIGMGGSIDVAVNTRQGGVAVGSWQVFYLLKIYEYVKDASANTFPRLSTPTEARLDPGRYWLWARDPATGRTSQRALVRIVGQTRLQVDLPVQ